MVILTLVINLLNQLNWKHIKKPIMTKPYNSTIMGMKNQIVSTLNNKFYYEVPRVVEC